MRCVEIITIVLLVSGSAFADVEQNQGQSTDVDQYQWQLNAGIGSSMGGNQSITYLTSAN